MKLMFRKKTCLKYPLHHTFIFSKCADFLILTTSCWTIIAQFEMLPSCCKPYYFYCHRHIFMIFLKNDLSYYGDVQHSLLISWQWSIFPSQKHLFGETIQLIHVIRSIGDKNLEIGWIFDYLCPFKFVLEVLSNHVL